MSRITIFLYVHKHTYWPSLYWVSEFYELKFSTYSATSKVHSYKQIGNYPFILLFFIELTMVFNPKCIEVFISKIVLLLNGCVKCVLEPFYFDDILNSRWSLKGRAIAIFVQGMPLVSGTNLDRHFFLNKRVN